jgi:hypothetical protein
MQLGFFVLGDGLAEVLARLNFAVPQNRESMVYSI